jgi:hypothetical protein
MRICLLAAVFAATVALAVPSDTQKVQGKLVVRTGQPPTLETASRRVLTLDGDEPTRGVLNDKRLNGFELEAKGHFVAPDKFLIDPIHMHAILVHKDGHLKYVTYWCDTCGIRTWSPGLCWCCQQETTLDLRDPDAQ